MKNLKLSLIDNDFVIHAKADLRGTKGNGSFKKFLHEIEAELVTGKTAYLEVEGLHKNPVTFAISPVE